MIIRALTFFLVLLVFSEQTAGNTHFSHSDDLANSFWIRDAKEQIIEDSLMYLDDPSPIFRREFQIRGKLKSAYLYITAAGYYSPSVNGRKIGKNYLDPAWTDYSRRVYYTKYDITDQLYYGVNCLGVMLGNGFFNPLPMKMWGTRNMRLRLPIVGRPAFIARVQLVYEDGRMEDFSTDASWKYSYGPILKNNVYLGEVYNAAKEIKGWNLPGFNDKRWKSATVNEGPGGKLKEAFFPAIQESERIRPLSIKKVGVDQYIVDMGVNFTGLYKIKLKGQRGDSVIFRFGERLYENGELNPMTAVAGQIKREGMGGKGAPAIAWQTDTYIFGNKNLVTYSPEFTFHIFRYMEISGLSTPPVLSDIEGIVLNTSVERNNQFNSSSGLLDSIQEITVRTFLNNLIGVQTDCPGRERYGYGDDLNVTSETFIYNFNMHSFYRKTLYDWADALKDTGFIDTAPDSGIEGFCGITSESTFLTTQYWLYLYYGDSVIIKELYDKSLRWIQKIERVHPSGVVNIGYGDYFALTQVPIELTGTCLYVESARIMAVFAKIIGDQTNEIKYTDLADKIQDSLVSLFWRKSYSDEEINKQTLFSSLLYYDIIPEREIGSALDSLLYSIKKAPAEHFTTGIFGTKYILEVLSRYKKDDIVFDIVNSREFPGWGHMIDKGATTIWETWKENDNTFSNCHPMFGSVSSWFFKSLGGIRPDINYPGFEKFIISPSVPDKLNSVQCSFETRFGKVVSNWKKISPDSQLYEIIVPKQTRASVKLPIQDTQTIKIYDKTLNQTYTIVRSKDDGGSFSLVPGEYLVTVSSFKY